MNRNKILTAVEQDMEALYNKFRDGKLERADADSFANIAGKRLKAVQIHLADEIFGHEKNKRALPEGAAAALTHTA